MTTLLILVALLAVVFAFVLSRRVEKLAASEKALREDRDFWHAEAKSRANDFDELHRHNVRLQGQRDAAVEDLHAARTECIELEAVIANVRQRNSERGRKAAMTRRARRQPPMFADAQGSTVALGTGEVTGEVTAEVAPTLTTDAEGEE